MTLPWLVCWLVLGLLVLVGTRRLWQEVFGPVLRWELVRQARRGRFFGLRIVYLAVLLAVIAVQYVRWFGKETAFWDLVTAGTRIEPEERSAFAFTIFVTVLEVQLGAVLLLTPGFTAGAIAEERDRRTLDDLLVTDLSDGAVVVGKLVAHVGGLSLLLLSSLPVMAFLQLLGGIDPNFLLAGYPLTLLFLLGLASLGIFCSALSREPHTAIFRAYALAIGYLLVTWLVFSPGLEILQPGSLSRRVIPHDLSQGERLVAFPAAGNPVFAWGRIRAGLSWGLKPEEILPPVLLDFALFHGLLALVCLLGTVYVLRRVAALPGNKRSWVADRPSVWEDQPLLWKECHAERGWRLDPALGALLTPLAGLLLLSVTFTFCLMFPVLKTLGQIREQVNVWLAWVLLPVACFAWVAVAVRAAAAFSGERGRGTLDSLLTTDLSDFEIVDSKWRGSLLAAVNTWYGLAACVLWGGVGGLSLSGFLLVPAVIAVEACLAVSVGLSCSLTATSNWQATARTLVWLALLTVGHWAIYWLVTTFSELFAIGKDELLQFHAVVLTPPITLLCAIRGRDPGLVSAALLVHGVLAPLLLRYVHARFARATGRMPVVSHRGDTV
jgi:ABC-type transport system involved in multi-copper enzyme maturation permease subunit